jgi:hypothetical protein
MAGILASSAKHNAISARYTFNMQVNAIWSVALWLMLPAEIAATGQWRWKNMKNGYFCVAKYRFWQSKRKFTTACTL